MPLQDVVPIVRKCQGRAWHTAGNCNRLALQLASQGSSGDRWTHHRKVTFTSPHLRVGRYNRLAGRICE